MRPQKTNISPAYLRNDNNKYLNYTDDWYILASKPDEYVVIYYKGNNDAWKGYGGATVYTRCVAGSLWREKWAWETFRRGGACNPILDRLSQGFRALKTPQGLGTPCMGCNLGCRRWERKNLIERATVYTRSVAGQSLFRSCAPCAAGR